MESVYARKVISQAPDLDEFLFWMPLPAEYPIIDQEVVWTEKEALEYVLSQLLEIKEENIRNVLLSKFKKVYKFAMTTEEELELIKIPSVSPDNGKSEFGQSISLEIMRKIHKFKTFSSYLCQYK